MTGSLQIKNDKYYMVLNTTDKYGKRKQKWSPTGLPAKGNRRRAEVMLRETLVNHVVRNDSPKNDILFSDWVREWLKEKCARVNVITAESYINVAAAQIYPYFNALNIKLCDITPDVLQAYFDTMSERGKKDGTGGLSPNTLRNIKNVIRPALKKAVKHSFLTNNPCDFVILPKRRVPEYTFYNEAQINTLLEAIKDEPLYPIVRIAAFYGLRRSEAIGLKWDSIDFVNNTITIRHTVVRQKSLVAKDTTKTVSSHRSFPLDAGIRQMLSDIKNTETANRRLFGRAYRENDYVFKWGNGTPIYPDYVTRTFRKLLKRNKLPHIRFHDLRHSCASLLLANGFSLKDIQEWLGHADIAMTSVYSHLDMKRKRSMAKSMARSVAH